VQQPKHLVTVVLLLTITLTAKGGCVVTANFLVTKAVWPGTNHACIAEKLHRNEATGVVGSNRTEDDERFCLRYPRETELIIHADGGWSNVERVLWLVWNPIFFKLDQAAATLKHLEAVEGWDSKLQVRLIHSSKVLVRPK